MTKNRRIITLTVCLLILPLASSAREIPDSGTAGAVRDSGHRNGTALTRPLETTREDPKSEEITSRKTESKERSLDRDSCTGVADERARLRRHIYVAESAYRGPNYLA